MKHRFELAEKRSKSGWVQLMMVLEVSEIDKITLSTIPRYLISHVNELVSEAENNPDRMFPIIIETSDGIHVSEQIIWELIIENEADAQSLVLEYVDTLCNLVRNDLGVLFFNSEEYFVGSHAIFAYLNYFLNTPKSGSPDAIKVYNCFLKHLMHCDLEFEVFQDEYISKVLRKLRVIDKGKYFELLYFRLFNGQETIGSKDYRYLANAPGVNLLKEFIDFIIEKMDSAGKRHEAYIYKTLLAAVYGSAEDKINEVMHYIREKAKGDFEIEPNFMPKSVGRIQAECDAYREVCSRKEGFYDTGFHKYDKKAKLWISR